MEILSSLTNNSRESVVTIAKKLKTTSKIVQYSIKKLQQQGILSRFRLIPNVNILGMDYYKVLIRLQNITRVRELALFQLLEEHPNVINYTHSWGPWDIEFEAELENYKELIKIIHTIRESFPDIVQNIESLLITKEHKPTNNFLLYKKIIKKEKSFLPSL